MNTRPTANRSHSGLILKVGDLAKRTGISVRTLHYYEEIGLLIPSHRTNAGHRKYSAKDIAKLQQILSLQALGFTLDEIGRYLGQKEWPFLRVVEQHLEHAKQAQKQAELLVTRLEKAAAVLRAGGEMTVGDLLKTIEVTIMFEKYYTEEQLKEIEARRIAMGEEGMRKAQQDWQDLFVDIREAMGRGIDAKGEEGQKLFARYRALIDAFTGKNPGIEQSLSNLAKNETKTMEGYGVDPVIRAFLEKASA